MLMLLNKLFAATRAVLLLLLSAAALSACAVREPVTETPGTSNVEPPAAEAAAAETSEASAVDASGDESADATEAETAAADPAPVAPQYNRDDVIWIQRRLQELGYFEGRVDGVVGNRTTSAVRAYQRDQDIKADGRPTKQLREFMWRNGG